MVTDPNVPPVPPHLDFDQAKSYLGALLKGGSGCAGDRRRIGPRMVGRGPSGTEQAMIPALIERVTVNAYEVSQGRVARSAQMRWSRQIVVGAAGEKPR